MTSIYLRGEVEKAIETSWPAFAEAHPHLAGVLDRDVMVEEAIQSLRNDPDFSRLIARSQAAGMIGEAATVWIGRFITNWLKRLV